MQDFQELWHELIAQVGNAGEITARSVQARDEFGSDRINPCLENDWYGRRGRLGSQARS